MAQLNGTLMQFFHWYSPADGTHWKQLCQSASELAQSGFTALWLPPAYKASGGSLDVGYGTYDLFDLGEFDQKGSVRTKYGTKDEFLTAIKAAQAAGLAVYADIVFNHKNGGDQTERLEAVPVDWNDRNHEIGGPQPIEIYSHFTFPGRGSQYSSLQWHWWHFDAVNHNALDWNDHRIYRLKDKHFDTEVDLRHGNYDFLMACDLDMGQEEVKGELAYWGRWFLDQTGVDGFRIDAVKHIRSGFFRDWLDHVRHHAQADLFAVGEYWIDDIHALHWYLAKTGGRMALFDVPLHYNFHRASRQGNYYDLRTILDGTLMEQQPALAVTFVENHDSQPLQMLESVVEPWFKPLAYALILLRREGYPCIFHGDYYGAHYRDRGRDGQEYEIWLPSHRWLLDRFLAARTEFAYGDQYDYFDHANVIGWTRLGDAEHPKAMAVLLSNGAAGYKWMEVGRANTKFIDTTHHVQTPVVTNEQGWGRFQCHGGSVSVWLQA
ncbi:alpha-amylase [Romeria aff. gracilis LEGE 07310]|uniref:Alpha-amylase n=1 Tax=Vasconcelosia minhoensis LEGE 07310 TaxID=915328 RepID=A0A8J7AMX9_9CYAN|nr:alpha-amylase [Romeria gracilis]MBE9077925.1 alpha-amylase [Romeria aff. gracilis LEGE 07310]